MKNMWKLSNYFFAWMMKRGMAGLFCCAYIFGGLGCLLANAFPSAANAADTSHLAEGFLPYEMLLGDEKLAIYFVAGLVLVFFGIFHHAGSYRRDGRAIYTLYTLPMKREQVYAAFLLSGIAMIALYFLGWLLLILVGYAPIMANHARAATEEVFYVSPEVTVSGLDAVRTNGLFLAFQRNAVLYIFFPANPARLLALLSGLLLILTSGLYFSLSLGERWEGILMLLVSVLLGGYCIVQALIYRAVGYFFNGKTQTGGVLAIGCFCLVATIGVICLSIWRIRKSYTL